LVSGFGDVSTLDGVHPSQREGSDLASASDWATEGTASPGPQAWADPAHTRVLNRWLNDTPIVVKGLLALALPVMALVVLAIASLFLMGQQDAFRSAAVNETVGLNDTSQTLLTMIDAETGVRGYAATGSPVFLNVYESAKAQIPKQLDALQALPSLAGRSTAVALAPLLPLIHEEIADLERIRSGVASGRLSKAALTTEMVQGKRVMDRIRAGVASLQKSESLMVAAERARITTQQTRLQILEIVGLVIGVLGGIFGVLFIAFGVARRMGRLADNSGRFIRGEQLLPMEPSKDEIGRLSNDVLTAGNLLAQRNQQLGKARDEAMAASAAKDTFLSRMSHELRTPLTAILGFGQLLQMDDLTPDQIGSIDQIVRAGHHLLDLINEVLDISRIEAGHLALSLEPVSLGELVHEVTALMTPLAAARDITLEHRVPDGLGVIADRQRLKQVALNLVSNAIKYNRDGGTVVVSAEASGSTSRLVVTDTGSGIPEAKLDRLFVPFDRLDADRSEIVGSGVGLSLSESLVHAMNGTIEVQSEVGEGSTFAVVLPKSSAIAEPAPDGSGANTATEPGARNILYVEDNLANLRVLERIFKDRHEKLQVAVQGQMCLDLARELFPQVILLDLHLPDMSGEEVLRRLKADPATAGIPVVILSADASQGSVRRLLDRGAAAYLPKPIDVRLFVDTLDTLIARQTSRA
jgi:signal transduction histidine kinase/ActR/RegA family two-component response regulator